MKNSKMQFAAVLLSTLCLLTGAYGQITGVTAGTDLTGGGTSGNVTLNLNTANVPQLATANTFTGNQAIVGNLTDTGTISASTNASANTIQGTNSGAGTGVLGSSLTGVAGIFQVESNAGIILQGKLGSSTVFNVDALGDVSATSFQIEGNPFAFGSYASQNAFLGFAGNSTTTGRFNTASGYGALAGNTSGQSNSAGGQAAMYFNTTGYNNTAFGSGALYYNTTGGNNTGMGMFSGSTADESPMTGGLNSFLGYGSSISKGSLSNATAIGAFAEVGASNSMVLGSINGVNGATVSTNVGIGTIAPVHLLDVAGTVAFDSTGLNNGSNFIDLTFGLSAGEGISSSRTEGPNQYGIDLFTDFARRISIEQHGNVGIGTTSPDNLLTVNGSADKPGGGSWGTYSDGRLKNLNGSYHSGLSQVLKLNPVRYRYKSDNAMGIRDTDEHIGVVAQDVQRVIPEAVTENSKGYLLVNNDPIIWSMLNAIKEQQEEIRALKSELRVTRQSLEKVQTQVARTQPALVAEK
jgi:trimeric autotransporter adhesin